MQKLQRIVRKTKRFFERSGNKKAVVGLSGGIDSSVAAALCARAIGKKNIHGVIMPEKGVSLKKNVDDAKELAKKIGIIYDVVEIGKLLPTLPWKQGELARMNTSSRVRAVILYNYANSHDALVLGTSNKSEILLGYYTKYGDGAVDLEIIGSLFKTEVYKIARYLGIPRQIIEKPPTAELRRGQTDEKELGASYEEIDHILKQIRKGSKKSEIKGDKLLVRKLLDTMKKTEHKRNMPPVI